MLSTIVIWAFRNVMLDHPNGFKVFIVELLFIDYCSNLLWSEGENGLIHVNAELVHVFTLAPSCADQRLFVFNGDELGN
jgi:hypothetical protein